MRAPYNLAPETIRARIETKRRLDAQSYGSPAVGQLHAMRVAYAAGYDWPPALVHAPLTEQLNALYATNRDAAIRFRRDNGIELRQEQRCLTFAESLRKWAATTSLDDDRRQQDERQAAERQKRIEARAAELLATEDDKRRKKALSQAAKEIEHEDAR